MTLTIDYLKKNCSKIHAFGLGFIQIKLGLEDRVHIYCPEAGLTTQEEEIHNHRYNFESSVLKGKLTNKIYEIKNSSSGSYRLVNEACNPDLPKDESFILVEEPILISSFTTTPGEKYFLHKDTFHRVQAEVGTITSLKRGPVEKSQAQVIAPQGLTLTCPFSLNLPEDQLWEIVRSYL